ncbi:NTPase [Desulfurococcus amylolyticus]|uniref:Nucleoside-triphosphatase Desfe_0994 n=1 Tax=Desulfurococcus amylolyticus DSM 16532 TaxID=768672 RepID=I3XSF2_DESAM|nr:NTPase [Desulfurococcus amylolyticus]AFL66876.1 Nucleoside-triphosphatase [Desulfurococcus amylolyticus DSM 16532]
MKIIITGRPGVGKSTFFEKLISELRESNLLVGGIKAPEVREHGVRIGFKVIDLLSGEEAWLAKKSIPGSVRIGSYTVLVEEASRIIETALRRALGEASVIGIDEVGPMELKIPVFKPLLLEILDSGKPVILVVHYRLTNRDILGRLSDAEKIVLTMENREHVKSSTKGLINKVIEALASSRS